MKKNMKNIRKEVISYEMERLEYKDINKLYDYYGIDEDEEELFYHISKSNSDEIKTYFSPFMKKFDELNNMR